MSTKNTTKYLVQRIPGADPHLGDINVVVVPIDMAVAEAAARLYAASVPFLRSRSGKLKAMSIALKDVAVFAKGSVRFYVVDDAEPLFAGAQFVVLDTVPWDLGCDVIREYDAAYIMVSSKGVSFAPVDVTGDIRESTPPLSIADIRAIFDALRLDRDAAIAPLVSGTVWHALAKVKL